MKQIANSIEKLRENQKEREHMNKWTKRELKVGEDLPEKGEVSDYVEGTPEKTLIEFIYYLKKNNFGNMAKMVSKGIIKDKSTGKLAGELREIFDKKKLIQFELVSVYDNAPAISEIEVLLEFERVEDQTNFEVLHTFRLCYEGENGDPVARGYKEAEWKIMIHSIYNLHNLIRERRHGF